MKYTIMAAKKWDMAAAVASHLVRIEPENVAPGGFNWPIRRDGLRV